MKIMMDGMMAPERRISFLQINICGLSNHSKIAIDAYLKKQKPDVVFLNETKQQIPDNAFTNYTTLSSTHKQSTGGVALLFRNDVAYAQTEELETKNNDNIVAAANVRGLKLLTTTAYVKPDDKGELLELIKDLKPVKSTQIQITSKVSFSLATATPDTYTGAIRSAMHLEMS